MEIQILQVEMTQSPQEMTETETNKELVGNEIKELIHFC